jgi:hypothetical protein
MRVWSSAGMLTLRRDLDAHAEEKLRDQLEGLLADRLEVTRPREWRQTFSSPQG